jgi:CheY-like chemotaxis protein
MKDRIDLLLTDVIMPRMNGRELAEKIKSQLPGIHVLFMSGYTWDVIQFKGVLEQADKLIVKPFDTDQLLRRVREALDLQKPPH